MGAVVRTPVSSLSCAVCSVSRVTYNAAFQRPAYQSSVYVDDHGSYPAYLANDGSRTTRSLYCAISQRQNNPWWAVDLGGPRTVSRVDILNTEDACCGVLLLAYCMSSLLSFTQNL